ncbi:MAG TPA: hypothetical protein PK747_08670 [Acidobacteriota bacterium]|nr:hypothetical protein [Acidobacteriota bacterium]HPA27048.1 hypothetical protein [Acidobacteriota bacterium]HQO20631.1 hypothetical protein [Acidobacteriota bacterium]HQQ47467.1 hypothetical protein [Acidobacteriota bacterium]
MSRLLLSLLSICLFCLSASGYDIEKLRAETEEIRGLKFRSPVEVTRLGGKQMREVVLRELDSDLPPRELAVREKALKAFGLLPPGADLRKAMESLLGDQAAGIYDPRKKKLYVREDAEKAEGDPLFDMASLLDMGEFFVIHEMAHALADQHFDLLKSLALDEKGNDDRLAAAMAAAEGDATLTMFSAMAKRFGLSEGDISALHEFTDARSVLGEFIGADVPRFLAETLLFSYLKGMSFVREVSGGRTGALDRIYREPPASTEQVLHPAKYIRKDDPPKRVSVGGENIPGADPVSEGTWGEFATGLILEEWGAGEASSLKASEGWGGDRYIVFEKKGGGMLFVWKTIWDTEKDAREFEASLAGVGSVAVSRRGAEVTVRSRPGKRGNEKAAKGDKR